MKDHNPERVWLLLLGASLASQPSRDAVMKGIKPEEFPEGELRDLAAALAGKDSTALRVSLERFGVTLNGKVLESLIEAGAKMVFEARALKELSKLEWLLNGKGAGNVEQCLIDAQSRIERLLLTKGKP